MDWSEVLKAALSFFLVVTGLALAYLFVRMAGVFSRLSITMVRVTDEVVPILNKGQTTMDGVNREMDRVDEIMVSAVHGAKGAEQTMVTLTNAVSAPVRKLSGLAAGLKEAGQTFQARRRIDAMERGTAPGPGASPAPQHSGPAAPGPGASPAAAQPAPPPASASASAPTPPKGGGIRTTGQEVPPRPASGTEG